MKAEAFQMAVTPWAMLRGRMCMHGVDQKHLARLLKRGPTYVSLRLNGHALWDMQDALTMMQAFGIPREQFLDFFGQEPVKLQFRERSEKA